MAAIVHSLLNRAQAADVRAILQQFSLQLLHLKIHFSAAGLFDIDRSLYFTVSAQIFAFY